MKILVTGGVGFIGSHVTDAYIAGGHDVVVVDDLSTGSLKNLNPKAKFYNADITDFKQMTEIFAKEKPEVVNHHAAQVSVTESEKNPARTEKINVDGTLNLLKQSGIKRFIFASTGGAMFSDPRTLPANEETPANPLSAYGISKLSAEKAVAEFSQKNNFSHVILRYSNVFGPRQNSGGESGVVAIFCDLARTNDIPTVYSKTATRDYVYVGDVARANLIALSSGNGIYHIATGVETTNQYVFETVRDVFGWKTTPNYQQLRPGELTRSSLDASKAKRELNWKPEVSFKEGVKLIHEYQGIII